MRDIQTPKIREMDTTEGNVLINAFMNDTTIEKDVFLSRSREELKYHSSWDWLMPVYHKCQDVWTEEIKGYDSAFYEFFSSQYDTLFNSHKLLRDAVLNFIEWYNKQK